MTKFPWPVFPYRGIRGIDASGGGGFGAPRGPNRTHPGLDCITVPGDHILALFAAPIARKGIAYTDDPSTPLDESDLGSLHLRSGRWWAQYLYLRPHRHLDTGDAVLAKDCIGIAQDRAQYAKSDMTNHVHIRLKWLNDEGIWTLMDPALYLTPPEDFDS